MRVRRHRLRLLLLLPALALFAAAPLADEVILEGALTQGGLIRGKAAPGSAVFLDGRPVRTTADGHFLLGFHRDAPPEARLRLVAPDGRTAERRLMIEPRTYEVQRIDGLPQNMVTPSEAELARIRAENARIAAARAVEGAVPFFLEGFAWPVEGIVTGLYGSQRILNGEPRQPHFGIDIAAPEGTPVRAPAGGVVTLAEPDLYFTGGTVILEHGHGLSSTYSHLATVAVRAGEEVARGALLGTVGATGRATGPHLDWRFNLGEARLDPMLVAGPAPGGS